MSRSFVWTLAGCVLGFVIVGVTHADPEWPRESGLDFWNVPQYQSELDACRRISDELDQKYLAVRYRNETKQFLAREIIDGRLTLEEAVFEFRELSSSSPGFLAILRGVYPGYSDDELYCRNVIAIVGNMPLHAEQRDEVVSRLDAQFRMLRVKGGGTVLLPKRSACN
jgi:hypothetical protein